MYCAEADEYVRCKACQNEVSLEDSVYPLARGHALCFDCATARGGVYHELLARWSIAPQMDDLGMPDAATRDRLIAPEYRGRG